MNLNFRGITYQGIYKGFGVVIEDFHFCEEFRSFGKGTFSRNRPIYYDLSKSNEFVKQILFDVSELQILSYKWFTRMRRREILYSDAFRISSFTREFLIQECRENTAIISNVMDAASYTYSCVSETQCATIFHSAECYLKDNFVAFLTSCIHKNRKSAQFTLELGEYIHLTSYETLYLANVEKSLILIDENYRDLVLSLFWSKYTAVNSKFEVHYAAYVYFKSKGWVPKSGSKYGAEFVLYKWGPEFTHSDFGVVLFLDNIGIKHLQSWFEGFHWMDYTRLNRILGSVVKKTLICYISPFLKNQFDCSEFEGMTNRFTFSQYIVEKWDTDSQI